MKKIFLALCVALLAINASAQAYQGQTAIGANLVYGSYTESLGFGVRFQYVPFDQIRGVAEFDYFSGHKAETCATLMSMPSTCYLSSTTCYTSIR